jgi:DNA-binding response OmpR family regulator
MFPRQRSSDTQFRKLRVLVVDDSSPMRRMITGMLWRFGMRDVTSARDGRSALDLFDAASGAFDIIICDWKMPEMTGSDVLRAVRQMDPKIPFLMVTGNGEAGVVIEAIELGVSGYLMKPFSPRELESRVRAALARGAARPSPRSADRAQAALQD